MTITIIEVWNIFITLPKETPNFNNCHLFPHPPTQPWVTYSQLFVSIDLPILEFSCERNHKICGFLCLLPFTWNNISKFPPRCNTNQHFFPFYGQNTKFNLSIHQMMDIWIVSTF